MSASARPGSKSSVAKKAPVKKAVVKKAVVKKAPAVKKAVVKKAVAKKAPAVKKAVVQKAVVQKTVAKKAAPAKAVPTKAVPTKAAAPAKPADKPVAKPAPKPLAPALDVADEEPVRKPVVRKPVMGTAALVSAGPGDPQLVTLRAATLLRDADVIVTDAEAAVIAKAHAGAESVLVVAADARGGALPQAARTALVLDAVREGKNVVRLVSGDPVLDGTLLNEAGALMKARVDVEVVPGVSEVTGVPAFAGFGLTGGRTRQVRIVDANDTDLRWADLVAPRTTLVFLGGADRAADIAARLLHAGLDASTPMAITRDGTTVDQRTVVAPIAEAATSIKATRSSGPGLVVVGEVIAQREKLDWFEVKSLFGWRILIPRTQDTAGQVTGLLRHHGAVPVEVATISVEPPRTPQQIDRAIHGLEAGRYEWIGFTSVNAVRAIREKLQGYGLDARVFAGLKVAAVGESTVAALVEFGVRPDIVPTGEQTTSALLDEWPAYDSLTDPINRVFLPRADIATDTLVAGLAELGWEVEDVTAYRTVRAAPPPVETREAIKSGGFDAVVFTSSSTVRNLVGIAGKPHHSTIVACIGPQTAKAAEEHGLRVDVLAETSTVPGLVQALADHAAALRASAREAGEAVWRPSTRRQAARRKAT